MKEGADLAQTGRLLSEEATDDVAVKSWVGMAWK